MSGLISQLPDTAISLAIFDGVPADEVAIVLAQNEHRRFAPGDAVIDAGDVPNQLFVIVSGEARVTVVDRDGLEHELARVGSGMTVGEMSLVTGEQEVASVTALTDLTVVAIGDRELECLAGRFPSIHRNIGTILAQRLAQTKRLVAQPKRGRLVAIEDAGGEAELAWALACSISWHTRRPTLLLVVDESPAAALAALAATHSSRNDRHATLQIGPASLLTEIDELRHRFDHVLVLVREPWASALPADRRLQLADESIPALAAEDIAALRAGCLPAASNAGRALGALARDIAKLKVGFAFGAGSLRGYAHIGALAALERAGLEADYLAGTSVGSSIAALHAMGRSPEELADELDRCGKFLFRPTVSRRGLLSNRGLRRHLHAVGGDLLIEDLPTPLAVVAADLELQREVVLRRGHVWTAVLASISMPGMLPAVRVGGRMLVDGGILNPVPASTVAAMGAGVVVAIRLATPAGAPMLDIDSKYERGAETSAVNAFVRSMEMMQGRIVGDPPETPLITVTPEFSGIPGAKLRNFSSGRRYIDAGAEAVEAALPSLTAALPWLRQ
jgi:NTE family protein